VAGIPFVILYGEHHIRALESWNQSRQMPSFFGEPLRGLTHERSQQVRVELLGNFNIAIQVIWVGASGSDLDLDSMTSRVIRETAYLVRGELVESGPVADLYDLNAQRNRLVDEVL
jgi:hypothetical protein